MLATKTSEEINARARMRPNVHVYMYVCTRMYVCMHVKGMY